MVLLAAISIGIALVPHLVVTITSRASAELLGVDTSRSLPDAPLSTIGIFNAGLWLVLAIVAVLRWAITRGRAIASDTTWGCGYAMPSPRMQYTSRSFAELLSERLLPRRLRAELSIVAPTALFPGPAMLSSETSDPMTRGFYEPFVARWGHRFARLRWLQQGALHVYLIYILVTALVALGWTSLYGWIVR